MPLGFPPLRIGLAASALHRFAPNGALFRLLGPLEHAIREELRAELFVLGQTYDALVSAKLLADYPRLRRLPTRREGGLIHLVAAACKNELVEFVRGRFTFFDRFRRRIATGTTGGLLNELATEISAVQVPWVHAFHSGPLGGDVEIALEILENRCRQVIFLEDPHVARQHEADIELLERSARITTERTMCVSDRASADAWVASCERRQQAQRTG